jgi:DNA-binding NtrC family response regulator
MLLDGRKLAVVEDDPVMGGSLVQRLDLEGATVDWFASGEAAIAGIIQKRSELVLCDICLPDMRGEEVFRRVVGKTPLPRFIFMTAFGRIEEAVALMKAGAGEYLTKPFNIAMLLDRIRTALPAAQCETGPVLGISAAMIEVERLLHRLAPLRSSVLISGETGTGKEVCARLLHHLSPSANRPFMAVNCAAIPDQLLESEIFGHEAGAFTNATKRHLGYAERAGDGTLFLDEIGELPRAMQAKLLRLIEDRTFHRLGGEIAIPFKARLVCATNAELERRVVSGHFRADLLYRINVVGVNIPALRQRAEDIPWLMSKFFAELVASLGSNMRGISSLTEEAAIAYRWPGNVRELRNRIERALALSLHEYLMPSDLFFEQAHMATGSEALLSLGDVRDAAEKREIARVLAAHGGHINKTAAALKISRTTLWEKMKRFGLTPGFENEMFGSSNMKTR